MGLHNTAHYLAAKGRGNDDHLVHMSENELKGLQELAMAQGGSLTINPHTGLPEAGFLEQVLPAVAAAAATYFTAGAAAPVLATALGSSTAGGILAGAGAGALISGGTAALQGKNVGQAALMGGLGGGIAGGLGAYSPADLASSTATQQAAIKGGTEAATQTIPNAPTLAQTGLSYNPGPGYGMAPSGLPTPQQLADTQAFTGVNAMNQPIVPAQPSIYSGLGDMSKMAVQSLPALGLVQNEQLNPLPVQQYDPNNPMRWRLSNTFQGAVPTQPNPYYKATYADGGAVEQMSDQNSMQGGFYPQGQQVQTQFATPSQMPTSAEVVNSGYDPRTNAYTGEPTQRFDVGGVAEVQKLPKGDPGIFYDNDANTKGLGALGATQYQLKKLGKKYNVPMSAAIKSGIKDLGGDMSDNAAAGGTASLGSYSDGGRMLKGPGDGMSDSIPATIGKHQPARLADGEFVVPADVVSHLGNGSTDAGAKKLYSMMDKIRKARTGKKKQAPAVKADKFIPK